MDNFSPDLIYMRMALREAQQAAAEGEVPCGAVIVLNEQVIGKAHNQTETLNDPTAHAEILAIRAACAARGSERLAGLDIYVTLEPCPICAAAIAAARIGRLYYGARDPKSGGVEQGPRVFDHPQSHHRPEVYGGIDETEAAALLKTFFAAKR